MNLISIPSKDIFASYNCIFNLADSILSLIFCLQVESLVKTYKNPPPPAPAKAIPYE
jgi:lipoprotein signal peptidase